MMIRDPHSIIPTKVGISTAWASTPEMPAFAGMTENLA
jgi:hypothetical protein